MAGPRIGTPEPARHPDTREVPRLPPGVMGIIVAAIVALVAVGVMLDIGRDPQRRQERQRRLDQMRTSKPPTTPASVTTVALAAAAASGSARKVTRRALLGLGMLGQRE